MAQRAKLKKNHLVIQFDEGVLEREINLKLSGSDKKKKEHIKKEMVKVLELLGLRQYQPASQNNILYNRQERQELEELYSLLYYNGNTASNVNNRWWKKINKNIEPLATMEFWSRGKKFLLKDTLQPNVEINSLMTELSRACWHHLKPERAKDQIQADLKKIENDAGEIDELQRQIRIRWIRIEEALSVPEEWLSEHIEKESSRIECRLEKIYGLSTDENDENSHDKKIQERLHRRRILTITIMVLLGHYTTLNLGAIRQCIARLFFAFGIAEAEDEYDLEKIEEGLKREYSKDRQNLRTVFKLAKDLYGKTVSA
ncbi:MAG: hypothetical protein JRG97_16340 [Deltaproteobacteria bacterium]|nr:hypothetical protein [Deltaproteobacteria bacterium]